MTLTNCYIDADGFRGYLGLTAPTSPLMEQVISGACRGVDSYCHRRFWLDPSPVARTFVPHDLFNVVDLPDIGSTTGLVVETDPGGDGTWPITWATTDYQLLPQNAAFESPEPRPWDAVRAVGQHTFPWLAKIPIARPVNRVRITARWGWPGVPAAVIQASYIKAARLWHRKDSPQGVAGFGEFGAVRISRGEDPDICALLDDDYVRPVVLAA